MNIELKTLNKDGSLIFQGTLDPQQAQFILGVGLNFLLANGASVVEADDDLPDQNAPTTDVVQ